MLLLSIYFNYDIIYVIYTCIIRIPCQNMTAREKIPSLSYITCLLYAEIYFSYPFIPTAYCWLDTQDYLSQCCLIASMKAAFLFPFRQMNDLYFTENIA